MPEPSLRPLVLTDRPRFEAALAGHAVPGDPLAACAFPFHFIWQGLLRYAWTELEGHLCLFAGNQDGRFLALPPIGPDPCGPAMAKAFEFLSKRYRMPAITRVENAPESLAARCREKGYRVTPKGPDYVYRRADLVALQGDRYKSHRAAYNHCVAHAHPLYRPFRPDDGDSCMALFQQWRRGVKRDGASDLPVYLAMDAEHAHSQGITHAEAIGLIGRIVEVEGRIAAYTFDYPLPPTLSPEGRRQGEGSHSVPSPLEGAGKGEGRFSPLPQGGEGQGEEAHNVPSPLAGEGEGEGATFCILFEIADRNIKGLGAYIFREFCRELESYELINTMDDSGLEGLRRAKLAYHPLKLVQSYIVSQLQ